MGMLYGKYDFLATGGCIGDALFFFCSGFTLFQKPMEGIRQFPNWYKKRINRIYPSIISAAFLGCLFFSINWNVIDITLARPYWFIACIMLYYIAIYFIGSYLKNRIILISLFVAAGTAIWFYFASQSDGFSIYGGHYIRWLLFFIFMLFGAKLGTITEGIRVKPLRDIPMLVLCITLFYALFILGIRNPILIELQYFSFLPLLGAMYYLYKVGSCTIAEMIYNNKVGYVVIRFIGGLCLEIYLVQFFLFTDKMNSLFPLNILIMFIIIFIVAFLTRCFARFLSQTFKNNPYKWEEIISLY